MKTPITDKIHEQLFVASRNSLTQPNNVMVHVSKKQALFEECRTSIHFDHKAGDMLRIFGLRLIFTDQIGEDEIICTFDQK